MLSQEGELAGCSPSQGQKIQLLAGQRRAASCLQHWGIFSEISKGQENLGRLLAHETWTYLEKPGQEGKYKVLMTLLTLQCAKHGVNAWSGGQIDRNSFLYGPDRIPCCPKE